MNYTCDLFAIIASLRSSQLFVYVCGCYGNPLPDAGFTENTERVAAFAGGFPKNIIIIMYNTKYNTKLDKELTKITRIYLSSSADYCCLV